MKKLFNAAFFYLVLGLLSGIFARESTRTKDIEGSTMLNVIHTHVLVLGFVFFLIALVLSKVFTMHEAKSFNKWFIVYNLGLIYYYASANYFNEISSIRLKKHVDLPVKFP